jgi:TRAP-type C4-dicarboxylate transport system permease small subunit
MTGPAARDATGAASAAPVRSPPEAVELGAPGAATPPEDRPRIGTGVEEGIAAIAMALVCIITFGNVLVRYFTNASFAFTEEFSVFLLVVMTLAGASAAFARNRHIRMEYFVGKLGPRARRWVEVLVTLCGAALFAVLAFYGTYLFLDDWQYGTTSPGIGVPQWIYTIWLPLFSALITLRILGRLARLLSRERSIA